VPLGVDATYSARTFAVWHEFGVSAVDQGHAATRGLHVVFAAPSRDRVEEFWATATERGAEGATAPADPGDGTFGAVVRDPWGNLAEARFEPKAPNRHGSIVEHLRLTTADVDRSLAFYRAVAAALGFYEKRPGTFAGPHAGTLAILPGQPTQHAHVAFPGDREAVQRFHAAATAAGFTSNGEPGERPQYHEGYYAAYVLDPDGNNIEVVDHGDRR